MIEIDGSYGRGGGQILRTSIALSAITEKPFKISNIRSGKGLKAQHLTGIEAVKKITNGKLKNAILGSKEIEFIPGKIKSGEYKFDVGTAGSISLVLQALVPACIHADGEIILEITGGTHVKWSPTANYFQHVFCDFLDKMGIPIYIEILKYGFYPKGGGKIRVSIEPSKLKPLNLTERGKLLKNHVWSIATENLKKRNVAERQLEAAKKYFEFENENVEYVKSLSTGSSIHIHSHFENCKLGCNTLGELGKPAEKVGEECAILLKKQLDTNSCLDRWMADQILPFLALTCGKVSVAEITNHCLTNIWVIEKFLPVKFTVNGKKNESGTIICTKS
jgi:RNA 3'-terminal phosphate cyclase (GTP)